MMALSLLTLLSSSRYITSKFSGQPNTLLLLVVMACPLCMNSCQYVLERLIPALYTHSRTHQLAPQPQHYTKHALPQNNAGADRQNGMGTPVLKLD